MKAILAIISGLTFYQFLKAGLIGPDTPQQQIYAVLLFVAFAIFFVGFSIVAVLENKKK